MAIQMDHLLSKKPLRTWAVIWRFLSRRQGFIWRGLLCWLIGLFVLINDEINSFDSRFQIRGDQSFSTNIVTITLSPNDFHSDLQFKSNRMTPLQEIADVTDSFYWDKKIWTDLLGEILKQHPKSVGVSLFFSEHISSPKLSAEEKKLFFSPLVFWASVSPSEESPNYPMFASYDKSNIGLSDLLRDEDGVIRRHTTQHTEIPHMIEKLTTKEPPQNRALFINYRGSQRVFTNYALRDILGKRVPQDAFKNKIVLIGPEATSSTQYITPLGPSNRASILAQITDNTINNRWILRFHYFWYALGLLAVLILAIFIMTQYPQSVALIFLIWVATLWAALSIWVFDRIYVWIPVTSTIIMIFATYVIFIGYQANKIERKHWVLQQEQLYLQELEQLKNNFVSLISHDLKTPISKIQAILDRLIMQHPTDSLTPDLKKLKDSNEELNRYIQSILKVLRVESRDFKLHLEVGDINELIEEAVQQLAPLAQEKNIRLKLELEPLFSIEMDFTLIREVMVNLIENAIKYTPVGGQVFITTREENNQVLIDVIDTGEGIPQDEVDQIWGKFVRGKDQDLKTKGSGLGLYLVKFFIELHGGRVWLESQLSKGTKVSFSLPVESEGT
ncbi:MAG: hypothetical protein BroJett040_14870 [Oligoflexia bacterium]|nr:MAG: hypothetical protein BroJett040_14870 [Oligoflexia bacterium]